VVRSSSGGSGRRLAQQSWPIRDRLTGAPRCATNLEPPIAGRSRLVLAAIVTFVMFASCAAPQASPSPEPSPSPAPPSPSPASTAQASPSPTTTPTLMPSDSSTLPAESPPGPTAPPTPLAGPDGWVGPERISTRSYGQLSLVVDDNGTAHAAAELGSGIFYLTNGSGSWTRERLTRAPDGGADLEPSIARDHDGTLWLAFTRWSRYDFCVDVCPEPDASLNNGVYVMSNAGGGWSVPERAAASSMSAQIAVRNGRVDIVFEDDWVTAGDDVSAIHHATNVSGTWTVQHIDDGYGPTLALDSAGMAHVAFHRSGRVFYAGPSGGGFALRELDTADDAAWPRLSIDSVDRPHVAYTAWTGDAGSSVMHTALSDGDWSTPTVIARDGLLRQLAAGPGGTVHVVYRVYDEEHDEWEELWYAGTHSGAFETRRLIRGGLDVFGPRTSAALAIGSDGRPHNLYTANALYFGDELFGLWYAIGPPY
jgi:hypothetical protein